jgi:hypothetical protein
VAPVAQEPAYGADVLRLWVSSVDATSGDVGIGPTILAQVRQLLCCRPAPVHEQTTKNNVLAAALCPAACSVSRLLECSRSAEGLSPSGKAGAMRNGAHAG